MADVALPFLLENLASTLVRELSRSSRVREEILSIENELKLLEDFLGEVVLRNSKDDRMTHLLREIRNLSYRIEDVLETYAIRIKLRGGRGIKGTLKRFTSLADEYVALKKIEAEINSIKTLIHDVMSSFRVLGLLWSDASTAQDDNLLLRQTYAHGVDNYFVGMDGNIESLVSLMVDEGKQWHAISIYGMGGMGKSALANKLFKHDLIRKHFQAFAWVHVAKNYQIERIWEDILKQLVGMESRGKVMHMEDRALLCEQVRKVQQEKKCLIVLDDIWSVKAWGDLGISAQGTDSKILLTTRIREVAEYVSGEKFVHRMGFLDESECWELFKKRAFLKEVSADVKVHPMMEKMGKIILEQCRRLPLAIVMLGDIMGTKHTLREWEIMYQNSESYLSRGQQVGGSATISQVLALSYENLPVRLKLCFLHLGDFPEGVDIEVEKLYLLWIAEGIIVSENSRSEVSMMDIAENYLNELALQGMIEVQEEEVPIFRRFKSCRLHGLMRELCLLKGKEEEFMIIMDFRRGNQLLENSDAFYSTISTRRLAVYLDKHVDRHVVPLMQELAKHLQCLLLRTTCKDQQELVWPREIFCIQEFRLLKVLDFDGLDFQKTKLPYGIVKLVSLRFLSFKGCFLVELPFYIGSLPYLQILDLRVKRYVTMMIPDVLWKLKTLRYLYFPERFQTLNDTKLRLEGLTELETLHGLNAGLCCIKDLLKMTKLRHLSASADCSLEDLKWIISLLDSNSDQVLHSSLDVRNFDCYTEERHSVFRQLLRCHNLHIFRIEGHIGQLPSKHRISQSFVEIVLSGSELKKDPMATLGKLPNLQVLVLSDEALLAEAIICLESCFLKLKRLELSNLLCLNEWKLEDGSLPKLSKLTIESCSRLEMLPNGLRSLCSLREVKSIKMPPPFEQALLSGWADTYTIQHEHHMLRLSRK
ncbi:hypothetical protein ACH5RR_031573 [Cinchona calisaya]|uniref:Disease resistance protein n=1 Tax=Cinchona calisaya TaxID=153742 RepID=A0ABD2YGZ6_9GENT